MIIEFLQNGQTFARYYPELGEVRTAEGQPLAVGVKTRRHASEEARGYAGAPFTERVVDTCLLSIEPGWEGVLLPRTARKTHQCIGAERFKPGYIVRTDFGNGHISFTRKADKDEALQVAEAQRAKFGARATIGVGQQKNPEYRPDCLRIIQPGDSYAEYLGEAPAYQSGTRYCARCTTAAWGPQG